MIIRTPKFTRNYLLLKKSGFKLFESCQGVKNFSKNPEKNQSHNFRPNISIEKILKNKNILHTVSYNSKNKKKFPKYFPNINEYKKRLFLKNLISFDKNIQLEDYMKYKEIDLLKNKNIKTIYDARKTFFSENKINDNRTSYFYKEELFDEKKKIPLMIKDIQSNFILLKNNKNKKYKEYYLLKKLEEENKNLDFNTKISVKNMYIKSDKLFNKNKTFMNNAFSFASCMNYFNSFSITHKGAFNLKRKNISKIKK